MAAMPKMQNAPLVVYVPVDKTGTQLLFQAIAENYETKSSIITADLEISRRDSLPGDTRWRLSWLIALHIMGIFFSLMVPAPACMLLYSILSAGLDIPVHFSRFLALVPL